MLDNLEEFHTFLLDHLNLFLTRGYAEEMLHPHIGEMHCTKCGDVRRMEVYRIFSRISGGIPVDLKIEDLPISLFQYRCLQCDEQFLALIYDGAEGPSLAIFPRHHGGVVTPHTPANISYYLDQAQKSQSVNANSAAVAMFRAALEHLLLDQGYKQRMLGPKIDALEKDKQSGSGPDWIKEIDTRLLKIIKKVGNASIHTNEGDLKPQRKFDNEFLKDIKAGFHLLLFIVYEKNKKHEDLLQRLEDAASELES